MASGGWGVFNLIVNLPNSILYHSHKIALPIEILPSFPPSLNTSVIWNVSESTDTKQVSEKKKVWKENPVCGGQIKFTWPGPPMVQCYT